MPFRATEDRWVIVKISDKTWSTGVVNCKLLQNVYNENPINSMIRQKYVTSENETPPVAKCPILHVTREGQITITNRFRKNEVAVLKQK